MLELNGNENTTKLLKYNKNGPNREIYNSLCLYKNQKE